MNYSKLSKKLFLSLSFLGLFLSTEPSKSAEWQENTETVSCTTGHADMSNAAVGADHSQPFSIVSDNTNPHKACLETPEGYEVTFFKIGMCTNNPFNETNDNVDPAFTEANGCVWTMESDTGVTVDLAANLGQTSALPSASKRPRSGTYKYFVVVLTPEIKLKGSYTTTDSTNGGTFYTKPATSSVDTEGEFDSSLSSSQFFTAEFNDSLGFSNRSECEYSYQRTVSTGPSLGVLQAVLTNDSFETATTCSGITKLVGLFKANDSVTINDDTNGLEIAFSISGAGLFVEGGGGAPGCTSGSSCHPRSLHNQPIYAYAGDFVPTFKKF